MKKRNSFQLVIDRNQNIRINNLNAPELLELFGDDFFEFPINEPPANLSSTEILKSELIPDIELMSQFYKSCQICFRKCGVNRIISDIGWCRLNSENNVYMAHLSVQEEGFISPTYEIYFN